MGGRIARPLATNQAEDFKRQCAEEETFVNYQAVSFLMIIFERLTNLETIAVADFSDP